MVIRWVGATAALIIISIVILIVYAQLSNWDLGNRLAQVMTAPAPFPNGPTRTDSDPKVRLILHKTLPDEDAIEMSMDLNLSGNLVEQMKRDNIRGMEAEIRDATGISDFFLAQRVTVGPNSERLGDNGVSASTEHFEMPFFPSLSGFPFDTTRLLVIVSVKNPAVGYFSPLQIEVVKMLPARVMALSTVGGNLQIELSRSPIEKVFVVLGAMVFILLSLTIAGAVFATPEGLSSIEGILAVAGFVLSASGFRDLLGVPKSTGISLFDIVTFGLPFVLLTSSVLTSTVRRYFGGSNGHPSQDRNAHEATVR